MSPYDVTDKRSVAARLVGMARQQYLLGVTEEGEPFGADCARPHLAMLLRGGRAGLRADLAARYFADTGAAAGGQALTDSTLILEGLAAMQPPERLHLRVAEHEGTVYVDTGRPDGQVIRIGQGRWAVTNTAPVRFIRTKLTGEMPLPPQGGDVSRLWDFVTVTAEDRPVLLAVLIAALIQCDVPHPVLALFAEQGSAKSTTTRMLVDLIDPSPVPCARHHVTLEDVVEVTTLRLDLHVEDVDLVVLVQLGAELVGDIESSFGQVFEDVAQLASDLVHQVDLVAFTDVGPVEADLCFEVLAGGEAARTDAPP